MDVFFIGVGEACDSEHGNTSVLVTTGPGVRVLCDCGFSVPHHFFRICDDPDELEMVWISHFHGDHYFGLPLLLLRFWEMRRSRPLIIAGQSGIAGQVLKSFDMAYSGFAAKLCYPLNFIEIEPGESRQDAGLTMQTVQTVHSRRNLGLLLDDGDRKLYYSGDGRSSADVAALARDCDLAVHEAFKLEDEFPGHGSVNGCLRLAEKARIKRLALVHMDRIVRRQQADVISDILARNPSVTLPVEGTRIRL
ncbi:MAG: MBL fold metallo-hydrolase [Proteobacteria bacterium]|nr:MBL fold metallo-hydrolase [Pseudomonadota bacterium]